MERSITVRAPEKIPRGRQAEPVASCAAAPGFSSRRASGHRPATVSLRMPGATSTAFVCQSPYHDESHSRSKKPVTAFSRRHGNLRRGIYPQHPDHSRYYPFFETRLCGGQCRPRPGTGHPFDRKRHIDPHLPFAFGDFNQHPRQGRRRLLPDIQNPRPGIRRRHRHCHVSGPVGIHRVLLHRFRRGAGGHCFRRKRENIFPDCRLIIRCGPVCPCLDGGGLGHPVSVCGHGLSRCGPGFLLHRRNHQLEFRNS